MQGHCHSIAFKPLVTPAKDSKVSAMKYPVFIIFSILVTALSAIAQEGGPPARVQTAAVRQEMKAATAEMTGTLYFERTSRVSPEVSSRITAVTFREGDRMQKGDVLIRLDTEILEKELALERARLAQVKIRLEKSKLNLDRQTRLLQSNATPESVYDDQRFGHAELLQEQIILARQVDILAIRMAKHVVTAPFDGIVLEKTADVGEWVGPGSSLCLLGAGDGIYVQVPVAEHLIRFITPGDTMAVFSHALNREFTAVMDGIRPTADTRTKNISLRLKIDYSGPVARNMSVRVSVPVSEKQQLFIIPRDAVVQVMGQDMVYSVKEGKAVAHPVTLVYAGGDEIGVTGQGLAPGMPVVTQGNERLRPGQAVAVLLGN